MRYGSFRLPVLGRFSKSTGLGLACFQDLLLWSSQGGKSTRVLGVWDRLPPVLCGIVLDMVGLAHLGSMGMGQATAFALGDRC